MRQKKRFRKESRSGYGLGDREMDRGYAKTNLEAKITRDMRDACARDVFTCYIRWSGS